MDEVTMVAEGLKALNNAAVKHIEKGEYDEAEEMFSTIEDTSRMLGYKEGIGIVRMSLANLYVIKGNIMGALLHIDAAAECYPEGSGAHDLRMKISLMALEEGIRKENEGDLSGALELFERILPNLNEKRAGPVAEEIENIKRYMAEGSQ